MKTSRVTFLFVAIVAGLAAACSRSSSSDDDNAGKQRIAVQQSMDAEELAQAGEQLMTPYTFTLADKVFDMALSKDPTNYRARFYKSFTKPTTVYKGIYQRLRPFVQSYLDLGQYDSGIKQIPNSPLLDFLNQGPMDLRTESDLQGVLDQHLAAMDDLYKFLKDNEDKKITLNVNPYLLAAPAPDYSNNCAVTKGDPSTGSDFTVECDVTHKFQKNVELPDMIALRQIVAGQILYSMLYNTYTADGLAGLLKGINGATMAPSDFIAKLDQLKGFGSLRAGNRLGELRTFGSDLSVAWHYVLDHQSDICPAPDYSGGPSLRRGFLFNSGFCVPPVDVQDSKTSVAVLDTSMKGSSTFNGPEGTGVPLRLNIFAIADHPVTNLKSELPSQFNSCGQATAWRDSTLGGTFPDSDANRTLINQVGCQN